MIGMSTRIVDHYDKVLRQAERGERRAVFRNSAMLRTHVRRSMRVAPVKKKIRPDGGYTFQRPKPSPPGKPPKTRFKSGIKAGLRNSIYYSVNRNTITSVVGPTRSIVSEIGHLHEFGGTRRQERSGMVIRRMARRRGWSPSRMQSEKKRKITMRYPRRPFMRPAMDQTADRMAENYKNLLH
jgi:hypothetical protein